MTSDGKLRLTEKDEKVLSCIQLNAELTVATVAKMTRLTQPTVRRVITKLTEAKVIRKFWYIDPYALGSTLFNIWFTVSASQAKSREKIENYLLNSPAVVFFTETAGHFHYCATVQTLTLTEFIEFQESLANKFGACFREKSTATIISLSDLRLVKKPAMPNSVQYYKIGVQSPRIKIDEMDKKILLELSRSPDISISLLSRQLQAPASTVSYRFEQLKKAGVIVGCRYFVDYLKLGCSVAYHQISLAGMSSANYNGLLQYLKEHPSVYFVEECLGPWDLEVGTIVRSQDQFSLFGREVSDQFGSSISSLQSAVISRFIKLNGSSY